MFDLRVREENEINKRNIGTQALFETGSSTSRVEELEKRIKGPIYKLEYGNTNSLFHRFKRKKCARSKSKTKRSRLEYRNMDVSIQFLDEQSCHRAQILSQHSQSGHPSFPCSGIAGHVDLG